MYIDYIEHCTCTHTYIHNIYIYNIYKLYVIIVYIYICVYTHTRRIIWPCFSLGDLELFGSLGYSSMLRNFASHCIPLFST